MSENPWSELTRILKRGGAPTVLVVLTGGQRVTGKVLSYSEGWVRLSADEPFDSLWLNMDAIATWSLME